MKALIKGVWHAGIADTPALRLARAEEKKRYFRDKVTADGSSGFAAAKGRYHLYVSYACPWAHRAILYRALKGLEDVVPMSVAHPSWGGPDGWTFGDTPMSTIDHAGGFYFLYQAYQAAKPNFTGKVTVPALWDKERKTIVNNESGEIIRMLNSEFDAWGDASVDFYPEDLRGEIDSLNAVILDSVCNGVYKAGFASEQADYDRAVKELFDTMDDFEERLAAGPYLHGERVTESDWHLFATQARFDAVYHGRLKCNLRRLVDYPRLDAYTRRLYELPGVAATVKLVHIKRHYYDDLGVDNPRIVPAGPALDFRRAA